MNRNGAHCSRPCSLWTYNPLNNDQWGDSWNGENFSWFSLSDVTPQTLAAAEDGGEEARLNVGARVLDAVQVRCEASRGAACLLTPVTCSQRPYACKTAGIPIRTSYDFYSRRFTLDYINPIPPSHPLAAAVPARLQSEAEPDSPPLVGVECRARETEVFLPRRRYGQAAKEGRLKVKLRDGDGEWRYDEEVRRLSLHSLMIRAVDASKPSFKPSTSFIATPRPASSTRSSLPSPARLIVLPCASGMSRPPGSSTSTSFGSSCSWSSLSGFTWATGCLGRRGAEHLADTAGEGTPRSRP